MTTQLSPIDFVPSTSNEYIAYANLLTGQVLCLPIYAELEMELFDKILKIIKGQYDE